MILTAVGGFAADQRDTVARQMEAGLAAQRESVAKQAGASAAGSFFLTGPPAPIGPASGGESAEAACPPLEGSQLAPLIEDAARRENLEPALLDQVAKQESGGRPCAVSTKGAMGIMQIMPATARDLGVSDPFNPKESIDGAAKLLRKYLDLYGNLPMALGAYNAGPGQVEEAGGVPRIPETVDYVNRIMSVLPVAPGK